MEFTGERYVPTVSGQIKYEHLHRYALSLEFATAKTVLDIASGEGYGAALLAQVAHSVTGVDIDPRSVTHARHRYYYPNLNFLIGKCEAVPLPENAVDLVTCFETIEHHDKHEEMMLEIKRVLKPGGILVISSPNRLTYSDEPGYVNPFHIKELYYDELHELLSRHFKHVRIYGQRLAAGSFVYPLQPSLTTAAADAFKAFTGNANRIGAEVCDLSSPIYFVAVCSDDAAIEKRELSSIYLDSRDDLLKILDGERLEHISQLQAQLEQSQATIAQQQEVYEAQVKRQAEELSEARAVYEAQISSLAEELSRTQEQYQMMLARQADYEKRLRHGAEELSSVQRALSKAQEDLSGAQAQRSILEQQLQKREELLRHIYSSRSWRIASQLRHLRQRAFQFHELQHKVLRRLPLLPEPLFHGALDLPAKGSRAGKYLDVAGWVFSRVAPIARIEASVDGLPLGVLGYGFGRADIAAAYSADAARASGYAGRFSLDGVPAGPAVLVVRVWDEAGNHHHFTRSMTIDSPVTSSLETSPAVAEISPPEQPPVKAAQTPALANIIDSDLYLQLQKLTIRFETERGYAPSILNWNVDANLPAAFPHLALFSPPASNRKHGLPYIDSSIDLVMLASDDANDLAEARRVATVAVIIVKRQGSEQSDQPSSETDEPRITLDVESQEKKTDASASTGVSIIIPVYNKLAYTENCLEQLAQTLPDNFEGEIIVVDDASTDDTPAVLDRWALSDRRIKVLRNPQNVGFIKSCNRGAEAASQEVLVFLNNDTLPQPGWLQPLLRVLRDHPDAGAVGGKLIYPDGTLQEAGGVIFSDGSGCNFGRNDRSANAPLYNFLREVDYCSGALLATPRALFMEIGGFDTRYAPAYYEDTDYCFSLREKGYRVYYQPESVIIHFEGVSSGTDTSGGVKSYQSINRITFLDKWKHVLPSQPAAPDHYDFATLQALSVRNSGGGGDGRVSESDED